MQSLTCAWGTAPRTLQMAASCLRTRVELRPDHRRGTGGSPTSQAEVRLDIKLLILKWHFTTAAQCEAQFFTQYSSCSRRKFLFLWTHCECISFDCILWVFVAQSVRLCPLKITSWLFGEEKENNYPNLLSVTSALESFAPSIHNRFDCIFLADTLISPSRSFCWCIFLCDVGRNQQAGPQAAGFPGQSILSDPMSNLAMAYGSSLATQGREMVDKNVRLTHRTQKGSHTTVSKAWWYTGSRKKQAEQKERWRTSSNNACVHVCVLACFSWTGSSQFLSWNTTLPWIQCTWGRSWAF